MSLESSGKTVEYDKLIRKRKACRECECLGLTNQSVFAGGKYDSSEIGAWSRWQGNLNAELMVIGQDFANKERFETTEGLPDPNFRTNKTLVELLGRAGFDIQLPETAMQFSDKTKNRGLLFFTNAILCLKQGTAQSPVKAECFQKCGEHFLRPLIDLVKPKVVVCLGRRAYRGVMVAYGKNPRKFRSAVDSEEPDTLPPNGISVFAVYHCGARVQNSHRSLDEQREDWTRIGNFLKKRQQPDSAS